MTLDLDEVQELSQELNVAMTSLGLTPPQQLELRDEPERALGWIRYAAAQSSLSNPPAFILARFRQGASAPDPNAWRGEEETASGPNYSKLLRCCEALVRHTGHEYLPTDLEA